MRGEREGQRYVGERAWMSARGCARVGERGWVRVGSDRCAGLPQALPLHAAAAFAPPRRAAGKGGALLRRRGGGEWSQMSASGVAVAMGGMGRRCELAERTE